MKEVLQVPQFQGESFSRVARILLHAITILMQHQMMAVVNTQAVPVAPTKLPAITMLKPFIMTAAANLRVVLFLAVPIAMHVILMQRQRPMTEAVTLPVAWVAQIQQRIILIRRPQLMMDLASF